MREKIYDCTVCVHRIPHPNPTLPFHHWQCTKNGLCVGDAVMNCGTWKRKPAGDGASSASTTEQGEVQQSGGMNT